MSSRPPPPPHKRRLVRPRGQPLLALALLMVSWVGARAALWEAPQAAPAPDPARQAKPVVKPEGGAAAELAPRKAKRLAPAPMPRMAPVSEPLPAPTFEPTPQLDPATAKRQREVMLQSEAHYELLQVASEMPLTEREANLAAVPPPFAYPAMLAAAPSPPQPAHQPEQAPALARWSGDAWLLLRPGGNGFNAPGAGLPGAIVPAGFYGGSQAGAVLRYRLAPASAWRPALYLRAASGIERPRGEEVALGFAFRPLGKVPVAAMVEGRATRTTTGTVVRPAAALVTELPPARLPGGLRAEAYLQAGYVGGRDATGFVDGQARIEKPLASLGKFRLRAGGGVWGGAQRGANRLDLGPTATLEIPLGTATSRLAADYRFRMAGGAAPDSGPVVTVSVGF
jgi:hypothetical protein